MNVDVRLRTPDEVDPVALGAFLERFFGPRKAEFLDRHGAWWHAGQAQRFVLESGGTIAAYCGVIPARFLLAGEPRDALWWIDLVVAPELRGRGLQTILDREVRQRADLLLGFPNELAARIHRQHSWGVREDLRVMLAPLAPPTLSAVRRATGTRGTLLRAAARLLTPAVAVWRRRLAGYQGVRARRVDEPDLRRWAELARRVPPGLATTLRDEAHLSRRYLQAPYRGELAFYESGPLVAIVRRRPREGRIEERVLDLFGDLDDRPAFADLLRFALAEAVRAGAAQVTALAGSGELAASFRRHGFPLSSTARFCWSSADSGVMQALRQARLHWTLGDSDNDDPA